jgi:hypothetical protein
MGQPKKCLRVLLIEHQSDHIKEFLDVVLSTAKAYWKQTRKSRPKLSVRVLVGSDCVLPEHAWRNQQYKNVCFPFSLTKPVLYHCTINQDPADPEWHQKQPPPYQVYPWPEVLERHGFFGPDLVILDRKIPVVGDSDPSGHFGDSELIWEKFLRAFRSIGYPGARVWTISQKELSPFSYGCSARKPWLTDGDHDLPVTLSRILLNDQEFPPRAKLMDVFLEPPQWSVRIKSGSRIYQWDDEPEWEWRFLNVGEEPTDRAVYILSEQDLAGHLHSGFYNGDFLLVPGAALMHHGNPEQLHHPWEALRRLTSAFCSAWKQQQFAQIRSLYTAILQFAGWTNAEKLGNIIALFEETSDTHLSPTQLSSRYRDPVMTVTGARGKEKQQTLADIYKEFRDYSRIK